MEKADEMYVRVLPSLSVWDMRDTGEKYYSDAHAVLYLVDSSDLSRMADSRRTLRALARSKDLEGAPLLVAVNKQDKVVAGENGGDGEDVVGFYSTADVVRPTLHTLTYFCVHQPMSIAVRMMLSHHHE